MSAPAFPYTRTYTEPYKLGTTEGATLEYALACNVAKAAADETEPQFTADESAAMDAAALAKVSPETFVAGVIKARREVQRAEFWRTHAVAKERLAELQVTALDAERDWLQRVAERRDYTSRDELLDDLRAQRAAFIGRPMRSDEGTRVLIFVSHYWASVQSQRAVA